MRVFSVDLPGHGRSSRLGRQSIDEYAGDLVDFLDAVKLSRAVFVGHGMGGAIAMLLALDHPDRTAGAVLISSGSRCPIPVEILENCSTPATFHQAVEAFIDLMNLPASMAELRDRLLAHYYSIRQALLVGDLHACNDFDISSRLAAIKKPVLVISGGRDELTPHHLALDLAQRIPGAALQTIEDAGHLLFLEQPRRVAGLLSLFHQTIPYQAGM